MIIRKETGIGPALRVFRHFTERRRFYPIRFQSGERALLLAAGMPAPSVELVRLALGGVVPWQSVWAYDPRRAGGYGDYIHNLKTMFSPAAQESEDSLNCIRDALVGCASLEQARLLLLNRERLAHLDNDDIAEDYAIRERRSDATHERWELGLPQLGSSNETAHVDGMTGNGERTSGKPDRNRSRQSDEIKSSVLNRYRLREGDHGRVLTCTEAPTVKVRLDRTINLSAKRARNYAGGSIFLDGVAQGEPFADAQKEIYNLKRCEDSIHTMAACEQAIVLIHKLRDLRRRNWAVLAKDGSLDTILAVWVLLNHLRLNDNPELRAKIMPMLRLEGAIDAHGPEGQYFCALPSELLHSTGKMLNQMRQQELVFKQYGRWSEIDLLDHIVERLRAIDELIYSPEVFAGVHEVEELAYAEIAKGSVAIACRSEAGSNEVERQLKRVYGERLGVLIFQNGPSSYRVRQVDATLPANLEHALDRLNLLDPAVGGNSQNRWHGSADVAFSPRNTGTSLIPKEIIEAVRLSFGRPRIVDVLSEIPGAMWLALVALLPTVAVIIGGNLIHPRDYLALQPQLLAALVFVITVGILFRRKAHQVPGLYGWRWPNHFSWLTVLPVAFAGAVVGGLWPPGSLGYPLRAHSPYEFTLPIALMFSLGAELLFRGIILGHLASRLPTQKSGGRWWDSWPTLVSSLLYAAASLVVFLSFSDGQFLWRHCFAIVAGALIYGMASGVARERSESILSSVLFHWFSLALLLAGNFLF